MAPPVDKSVPDILEPKTWVKYRPAKCSGCWAGCCTLPVRASAEDLFHMGYLEASQVNGPLLTIAKRLKKQNVIRSLNVRTRVFTLARHKNSDCVFLDENRLCKIYDRRPAVCREFPFNSARPGFCPSQKKSGPCGYHPVK